MKQLTKKKQKKISQQDKMYQAVVGAYEDQKKELLQENQDLREALKAIDEELKTLRDVARSKGLSESILHQDNNNDSMMSSASLEPLGSGRLDLPFDLTKADVETNLRERIKFLHTKLEQLETGSLSDKQQPPSELEKDYQVIESEIDANLKILAQIETNDERLSQILSMTTQLLQKLGAKLGEYRTIAKEQDQLISYAMTQPSNNNNQQPFASPAPKSYIKGSLIFKSPGYSS